MVLVSIVEVPRKRWMVGGKSQSKMDDWGYPHDVLRKPPYADAQSLQVDGCW